MSNTKKRWIGILSCIAMIHILLAYSVRLEWALPIALIGYFVLRKKDPFAYLMIVISCILVTLVYAWGLSLTGLNQIYYRPHEQYTTFDLRYYHERYQSNIDVQARIHGDLDAVTTQDIGDYRNVTFITDADGFRNNRNYHGQPLIAVGDSFIAGVGNSQTALLTTQLKQDFNLDLYNLSYPGDLWAYFLYIKGFALRHQQPFKVVLFLFEGNDFPTEMHKRRNPYAWQDRIAIHIKRHSMLFADTDVYRVTRSLYNRVKASDAKKSDRVHITTMDGAAMAFLQEYSDVAQRQTYQAPEQFEADLARIAPYLDSIVFIPTKARVYADHLFPDVDLPHATWAYLNGHCQQQHYACLDLTPALKSAAQAQTPLLWWRDDTHWNANGIAIAAKTVANWINNRQTRSD